MRTIEGLCVVAVVVFAAGCAECDEHEDCADDEYCEIDEAVCRPLKAEGESCNDYGQCEDGLYCDSQSGACAESGWYLSGMDFGGCSVTAGVPFSTGSAPLLGILVGWLRIFRGTRNRQRRPSERR